MNDLVKRLRQMAKCIYIAVEESAADDISDGLTKAADQIDELTEALGGLVQAVEMDAHENNSISGFTGARLTDARAALTKAQGDTK